MKINTYDVIILGGGPAGYHAAKRLAGAGRSVALIESKQLGGVCLNEGCIPSKIFLKSSKLYSDAKNNADRGINIANCSFDQSKIVMTKNKIIGALRKNIEISLNDLNIDIIYGLGKILGKSPEGKVIVTVNGAYIGGNYLIIATGSRSRTIPIDINSFCKPVVTNSEIFDIMTIPQDMLILGTGPSGLEMADYFSSLGTKITIIEKAPDIGCKMDSEIAIKYQRTLQLKGTDFIFEAEICDFNLDSITYLKNNIKKSLRPDIVFLCIGRLANVENIGLESIDIKVCTNGIITDNHCQTSEPNVYACGDVNGKSLLAHVAMREADVAVDMIIGKTSHIDYETIPNIIYGSVEYISVGKTEENCINENIPYKSSGVSLLYTGRYYAENNKDLSYCKLLINAETNNLIGCHILGANVSELALSLHLMIVNKMTIDQIKKLIYPHPTIGEIIKEAALKF